MNYALNWSNRAGSVRRVLRSGDQHVCGLCRSKYGALPLAHSCVLRCWSEFLALRPVIVRAKGKLLSYRCRFCARDHLEKVAAVSCAEACRGRLAEAFEVELSLSDLTEDLPARPPRRTKPILRLVVIPGPRLKKRLEQPHPVAETTTTVVADGGAKVTPANNHNDDVSLQRDGHAKPDALPSEEPKVAKAG